MGQVIPQQHPAVVLRSHYKLVKVLLAAALAAVIALSVAVVILANDDDQLSGGTTSAPQAESINYGGFNPATGKPDTLQQQTLPTGTRFDGGPDEGTRGLAAQAQPQLPAGTRFDGGPDEGTRGVRSYYESPNQRSSYQPAPADGTKARAGGPSMLPQGPGAR